MESDEELAARRVGQIVGRYRLERVLGVGGMGAVYAARANDGSVAAIKVLHPEMSVRRDVRERFFREGYVANSLQHPGAVQAFEHGETPDGGVYLAMELLVGETLTDRVKRHGCLPEAELLAYADQVLDVLAVAHDKGIVHRDLKPDNLFVTHDGRIKVLDFGLARLLEAAPGDYRTRSGMALGTLPYMAPEQALGRRAEVDARADLFALGATLFRVLSGRKIHEAPSEAELLIAMASKPAPALRSVAPGVSEDLARVVDLSLAFSRDARYPDARTMQADIRAVAARQQPPYATRRFAAQEEKTRAEPIAAAPVSRPPNSTVPLHVYNASQTAPVVPDSAVLAAAEPEPPSPVVAPRAAAAPKRGRWLLAGVGGVTLVGTAVAAVLWSVQGSSSSGDPASTRVAEPGSPAAESMPAPEPTPGRLDAAATPGSGEGTAQQPSSSDVVAGNALARAREPASAAEAPGARAGDARASSEPSAAAAVSARADLVPETLAGTGAATTRGLAAPDDAGQAPVSSAGAPERPSPPPAPSAGAAPPKPGKAAREEEKRRRGRARRDERR